MQEAQFAVHWKVGLHFYQSLEILENCIRTLIVEMTSFFSTQVLPPLPRPLPAVDRRNARPVRGRQHHDQDAGSILFYFAAFLLKLHYYLQAIKDMPNLCRDSQIKTLPKIADVLTQLLQVNFSALQIEHFSKHLTLSRKPILNISLSRVKTAGKSQ